MDIPKVRNYVGLNIISVIVALTLNFLAVSLPLNNKTTGELSDAYPNYFVPAGFTFSIWGIIYILLIGFMVFQAYQYYKNNTSTIKNIEAIGPWFFVSGLANATWILAWHYEMIGLSVLIMLVLLYSLIRIYISVHQQRPHSIIDRIFIALPFSVYLAWISVATIANITTLLVSMTWDGGILPAPYWAVTMLFVALSLGIYMMMKRQDIAFGAVICWAVFGIWSKQSLSTAAEALPVATMAKFSMTLLFLYLVLILIGKKTYFHESGPN